MPRWPKTALPLIVVALCASPLSAQRQDDPRVDKTDPRYSEDPRDLADPRKAEDPRAADAKPTLDESLEPLEGRKLFESLYSDGNLVQLGRAMADSPWDVLDYIRDQCDPWLRVPEDGEPAAPPEDDTSPSEDAAARELAQLADSAIGDTRFGYYVDRLLGLGPADKVLHEELEDLLQQGSALVETATTPEETLRALTPLRQSLGRARELDDLWAQSRNLSLIGQIQFWNDRPADARDSMREAVRIGRSIRDLDSVWNGLTVIMQTSIRRQDFEEARSALHEQHDISQQIGDEQTASAVLDQLVQLDLYIEAIVR